MSDKSDEAKKPTHTYHCPTFNEGGKLPGLTPAGEICPHPCCGRGKGNGPRQCDFVIKPL